MKTIKNISQKAFTLIELIIVIAIIGILVASYARFNFSTQTNREKISTELLKISTYIEEARNNAFIGKAYNADWDIPQRWSVHLTAGGSGSVQLTYTSSGETTDQVWEQTDMTAPFDILKIECQMLDKSSTTTVNNNTVSIHFYNGSGAVFEGCDDTRKLLDISVGAGEDSMKLRVNRITEVIQRVKDAN